MHKLLLKGNADPEKGLTAALAKAAQLDPSFNERYHYILKRTNTRASNATTLCLLITGKLTLFANKCNKRKLPLLGLID